MPQSKLDPSHPWAPGSLWRWPPRRWQSAPRPRSPPGPPGVRRPECPQTSLACLYGWSELWSTECGERRGGTHALGHVLYFVVTFLSTHLKVWRENEYTRCTAAQCPSRSISDCIQNSIFDKGACWDWSTYSICYQERGASCLYSDKLIALLEEA